jgi:uncharacterized phage infection (PIP) family protein YhgE
MEASTIIPPAMATSTDTEQAVLKAIADMSQRMEVGFAQVDTKLAQLEAKMDTKFAQMDTKLSDLRGEMNQRFAQVDTKFAQMDTKLSETKAELKGEIQKVEAKVDVIDERTKIGFWGFVGRAVIVSLLGFLLLMTVKYALTGTIKLM